MTDDRFEKADAILDSLAKWCGENSVAILQPKAGNATRIVNYDGTCIVEFLLVYPGRRVYSLPMEGSDGR